MRRRTRRERGHWAQRVPGAYAAAWHTQRGCPTCSPDSLPSRSHPPLLGRLRLGGPTSPQTRTRLPWLEIYTCCRTAGPRENPALGGQARDSCRRRSSVKVGVGTYWDPTPNTARDTTKAAFSWNWAAVKTLTASWILISPAFSVRALQIPTDGTENGGGRGGWQWKKKRKRVVR
eukprot:3940699-Rhodomonas_salina.2